MKILFLSHASPYNKKAWSGILHVLFQQLSQQYQVVWGGQFKTPFMVKAMVLLQKLWFTKILKKRMPSPHYLIAKAAGRHFTTIVNQSEADIVFAPGATLYIAYLTTSKPIIYYCDAVYKQLFNYYSNYTNMPAFYQRKIELLDILSIQKAKHIIYTSSWAKNCAVNSYNLPEEKATVIHFGANIQTHFINFNTKLNNEQCNLLFVGVNWERKGGDFFIQVFEYLHQHFPNQFVATLVGCTLPNCYQFFIEQGLVTNYPFLDKNNEQEANVLIEIYKKANICLLPTKADCTPVIISEANAYGIPVVSFNTGGIASILQHQTNGLVFNTDATVKEVAEEISKLWHNKITYSNMSKNCYQHYMEHFAWKNFLDKFQIILNELIK